MNTGEVDYRRAGAVTALSDHCPVQRPGERASECLPVAESRLSWKNFPIGKPIPPGQFYSVSIDHGVIADMVEPKFAFRRAVQFKNPIHRIGEIVILANVFEFSDASSTTPQGFLDFANFSQAKVVYYNPDVQEGQMLSFSNIPIVPPTEYKGRPVGLQVVILELDRASEPTKALLGKLAALGQTTGMLPGGVVAETLLSLGGSMLTNNNDDTILEYRFVLDPASSYGDGSIPTFEEGRYVLRRQEERDQDAVWRNIIVDPNTGQLKTKHEYVPATGAALTVGQPTQYSYQPFTDDTYLTLLVKRHPASAASKIAQQNLDQLNAAIKQAADGNSAQLTAAKDAIEKLVDKTAADDRLAKAEEAWRAAEVAGLRFAGANVRDPGTGLCSTDVRFGREAQSSEIDFRAALLAFRTAYLAAVNTDPKPATTDQAQILTQIAHFAAPLQTPLDTAVLADPTQFTSLLQNNGDGFVTAVLGSIRANRAIRTCPLDSEALKQPQPTAVSS